MGAATKVASLFGELSLQDNFTPGLEKAERGINRFADYAKGAFKISMGVAAAGLGLFSTGLGLALNEAMESQVNVKKLEAVIKSTGGVAGVTSKKAQDLADSLSRVTRFSDDAILQSETMLLTFTKIGQDIFPDATEATLNMAEMFGGDATQAAIQLGKALNDPIEGVTALRRVGVMLTAEQEEQIKKFMEVGDIASAQKVILGELNTEFGGLAVAAGDTLSGKLTILRNRLLNVAESIGLEVLPYVESFADSVLNKAVPAVEGFANSLISAFQEGGISGVATWARREIVAPIVKEIINADWVGMLKTVGGSILQGMDAVGALDAIAKAVNSINPEAMAVLAGGLAIMALPTIVAGVTALGTALIAIAGGALAAAWPLLILAGLVYALQTDFGGLTTAIDDTRAAIKDRDAEGAIEGIARALVAIPLGIAGLFVDTEKLNAWVGVWENLKTIIGAIPGKIDAFLEKLGFIDTPQPVKDLVDWLERAAAALGIINKGPASTNATGWEGQLLPVGSSAGMTWDVLPPKEHDYLGHYNANQPYAVGTGVQPELFMPSGSGTAYPAGSWPGGETAITIILDSSVLFDGVVSEGGRRNVTIFAGAG